MVVKIELLKMVEEDDSWSSRRGKRQEAGGGMLGVD